MHLRNVSGYAVRLVNNLRNSLPTTLSLEALGTPNGFEYIIAIDWFVDCCITALNVTGDTVVSCIIAQNVPLTDVEDCMRIVPSLPISVFRLRTVITRKRQSMPKIWWIVQNNG